MTTNLGQIYEYILQYTFGFWLVRYIIRYSFAQILLLKGQIKGQMTLLQKL